MRKAMLPLAAILAAMLILGSAQAGKGALRYTYLSSVKSTLTFSGAQASCSGSAAANDAGLRVAVTVSLQRKSGNSWVIVHSWYGGDALSAGAGGMWSIAPGNTYRTLTRAQVKNGAGTVLESASRASAEKRY